MGDRKRVLTPAQTELVIRAKMPWATKGCRLLLSEKKHFVFGSFHFLFVVSVNTGILLMKDITRVSDVNYLGDVLSVNDCG